MATALHIQTIIYRLYINKTLLYLNEKLCCCNKKKKFVHVMKYITKLYTIKTVALFDLYHKEVKSQHFAKIYATNENVCFK